jgi:hypothetical protein
VQQLRARVTCCLVATAAVVALVGCGSDSKSGSAKSTGTTASSSGGPVQNACPVEGCTVKIDNVVRSGDELKVTWTANYKPDFSKNHIHVYWDTYTSQQVSNDAEAHGVKQGSWHPTDEYPVYVTGSEASVKRRDGSTHLCVTAGDRNHNVIDPKLFQCTDVKDQLPTG